MNFNSVLFLSTIMFFSHLSLSHLFILIGGGPVSAYALELRVSSDSISGACPSCPQVLQITERTLAHSSQHYLKKNIENLAAEDAVQLARSDRSTSVFVNSDFSFEGLFEELRSSSTQWALDHKALKRVETGAPTVGYLAEVKGYRFVVVVCRVEECDDDANGVEGKGAFKQGDLVSVYPLCGFDVITLPSRKKLRGMLQIIINTCS